MANNNNNMGFSGNAGEWGEAFVLLHLLAHNNLYYADSDCKKIEHSNVIVDSIYRTETSGMALAFIVVKSTSEEDDEGSILVLRNNEKVELIPKGEFSDMAHDLFVEIRDKKKGSDERHGEFLRRLGCESLKASSMTKSDLTAKVYDGFVGSLLTRKYSIKSLIGSNPSLANASGAAYIKYRLPGFDDDKLQQVMAIDSGQTIVDRTKAVIDLCDGSPKPIVVNRTFDRNLRKCYWRTNEALGYGILYGQTIKGKRLPDAINLLIEKNPAGWDDDEIDDYEFGIRKYLWAVVFGMCPSIPWKGPDTVDGYLIATKDEEVLAYQVSRQRSFENYLLKHSTFDTPKLGRYPLLGKVVCEEDGSYYYYLQTAVKFNPNSWSGEADYLIE